MARSKDPEVVIRIAEGKKHSMRLAHRMREVRRTHLNLSQRAYAELCGVPERTYKEFERTGLTTLATFLAIIKPLNRIDALFAVFPERPVISPERPELSARGAEELAKMRQLLPRRPGAKSALPEKDTAE